MRSIRGREALGRSTDFPHEEILPVSIYNRETIYAGPTRESIRDQLIASLSYFENRIAVTYLNIRQVGTVSNGERRYRR